MMHHVEISTDDQVHVMDREYAPPGRYDVYGITLKVSKHGNTVGATLRVGNGTDEYRVPAHAVKLAN